MADPDISKIALARAWSAYLLINNGIRDDDGRHTKLEHFIRKCSKAGAKDAEFLAVEGLKYLKKLDGPDAP